MYLILFELKILFWLLGYIHSLKYPHLYPERHYIIITEELEDKVTREPNKIQRLIFINNPAKVVEEKTLFMAR
jgi:hypothetical protein